MDPATRQDPHMGSPLGFALLSRSLVLPAVVKSAPKMTDW